MTLSDESNFGFLETAWPELHDLAVRATRAAQADPDVTAVRLRSLTERTVELLFDRFGIEHAPDQSQYDRLLFLEREGLLERRLLAKLHTIRKFGNDGAHGRSIDVEHAQNLVYDAWTVMCWFVRFMAPDIDWLIRPYGQAVEASDSTQADLPRPKKSDHPEAEVRDNILAFPEERVIRIRREVAAALAKVDPDIRELRTLIPLRDIFVEDLNADQQGCAAELERFLADPSARIMLLKGDAGTGKTFMAKGLVEFLASQGRQYVIGAPTGRAAKNIGEKTGRQARTLHSIAYDYGCLHPVDDEKGEGGELASFKVYAKIAANRDSANTVYIVDEASLVSDAFSDSDFFRSGSGYLLKDLLEYVGMQAHGSDRKIIFIGDPAQLTPVGMNTSPALDGDYLHKHYGYKPSEYRLTEVVRQEAQSPILENVKPLRRGIDENVFRGISFRFDEEVVRLGQDEVIPTYLATARQSGHPPMVITRSNREAAEANRSIRAKLFPDRIDVGVGDRLIITANTFVGGQFLANGEFVDVHAVEALVERKTVRLTKRIAGSELSEQVEIELLFRDIEILTIAEDGLPLVQQVKVLEKLLHDGNPGLSPEEQRALYVDFLRRYPDVRRQGPRALSEALRQDPYFNAVRAKFGYAVTCHKAQGGEWDAVVVLCPALKDPRHDEAYRWLYTALTRARSRLFLVNPPEVRIKLAGSPEMLHPMSPSGQTPLSIFQRGLLEQARSSLDGSSISIDDVRHHQYQEMLFCSRGSDGCRVSIGYNKSLTVSSMTVHPDGPLSDELRDRLAGLVGRVHATGNQAAGSRQNQPSQRPFISEFDAQLRARLDARGISVQSMVERQWNLRYVAERDRSQAVIDIYFDGRERFKSCVPIGGDQTDEGKSLLREVIEIVTNEIVP